MENETYWDRHSAVYPTAVKKWFMGDDAQDKLIKEKFEKLYERVEKLASKKAEITRVLNDGSEKNKVEPVAQTPTDETWANNMHGRLALIILCDQFSRSIWRSDKKSFDYDHVAKNLAKELVSDDNNLVILRFYRVFELIYIL